MIRASKGLSRGGSAGLIGLMILILVACGLESGSTTVTSSVPDNQVGDNSIDDMDLGEVQFLDFGSGQGLDLNFAESAAEDTYWIVVHSKNIQEGSFDIVIQGDLSPAKFVGSQSALALVSEVSDEVDQNPMHELARAWEVSYASSSDIRPITKRQTGLMAMTAAPTIGDTKSFRVLNSMNSIKSYQVVTGRLRLISDELYVYVDTEMDDSSHLTDESILELANSFEMHSLPIERGFFGFESDVNSDDHITILMTPVLNEICFTTGLVTGFFFPGDLYAQNESNPASNEQEIFYTLVPDPEGEFCRALEVEFAMHNILPGVLAHEYQHMVSFNQHVFLGDGTVEEPWLNEALSHLAEDITGYGLENYSRVKLFLDRANSTTLIPFGLPTLSERGMGYLFMRYLYEQVADPEAFTNDLLQTTETGVSNIENALSKESAAFSKFSDAFSHWQVALVLSGTGLTDDSRFNYQERVIDSVTGNYRGMCLNCEVDDGRGTILTGPTISKVSSLPLTVDIESAGTRFFQIVGPGEQLSIGGSDGIELGGALIRLEEKQ